MTRIYFSNSPLKKGDKGGCEEAIKGENKKQPLPPLFLRGNSLANYRHLLCQARLGGKGLLSAGVGFFL